MKLYCIENQINSEEANIRCFLSYDDAQTFSQGSIVEFTAEISDVVVAEGSFETVSANRFEKSKTELKKYKFGTFLKPVYFVAKKEYEFVPASDNGAVKIFESNDRFYVECLSQKLKEKYPNYELYAVRSCFEALVKAGKMEKFEKNDIIFYKDVQTGDITPICKNFLN